MPIHYYGFSDKPFEISPDLKFLFLTPGYRIALEAVVRGITDRKGLIVLSGEVGTGKTMLVYGVLEKLPPKVKTAFIFHSTYNFKELLQQIFSELDESVPTGGIIELKNQLLLYLRKVKERGELLAILLDEAQKFSEEMMGGLFILLEAEPWVSETLQIILVGQPEIEETFNAALLRYHPKLYPLRIRINPLSREESLGYIEHRLKTAGSSSAVIFSPQALNLIADRSGGIPRVINILCDNALFAGYQTSVKKIEAKLIEAILRNLEGPGNNLEIKKKPPFFGPHSNLSSRVFIRDGLIILFGVTLVVGIFLIRPELSRQLTNFRWIEEFKPLISKAEMPGKKTQSEKETQENSLRIDLNPAGRPRGEEKKSRESQAPASSPLINWVGQIQVKEGDYLSKLVVHHYGKINESLIDLALYHNPSITNIDLVLIHQKLTLPELKEENLILHSSDRTFFIHLGTFVDPREAENYRNLPDLKGKNISVKPKKVSAGQTWYRVEAGAYENREEALEVIQNLKGKKLLPFF